MNEARQKKRALGRGLTSLISDAELVSGGSVDRHHIQNTDIITHKNYGSVILVPLKRIIFDSKQPRKVISSQAMEELVDSIKEHGVIQPIIVHKVGKGVYQVIAGERRCRAAREAGLFEIPVLIKDYDEKGRAEIAIVENLQRQDLTPLEESQAYHNLMQNQGYTQEKLSQRLGKSRSYIANIMRLSKLPNDVKQLLEENKITAGHAKIILNTKNPFELAQIVVEKNLSVRNTEKLVQKLNTSGKSKGLSKIRGRERDMRGMDYVVKEEDRDCGESDSMNDSNEDLLIIEAELREKIGSEVKILQKKQGYSVVIDCKNGDELDNILSMLSNTSNGLI